MTKSVADKRQEKTNFHLRILNAHIHNINPMGIPNEKINWIQNILLFAMLLKIKIYLYNQLCCVDIYTL